MSECGKETQRRSLRQVGLNELRVSRWRIFSFDAQTNHMSITRALLSLRCLSGTSMGVLEPRGSSLITSGFALSRCDSHKNARFWPEDVYA